MTTNDKFKDRFFKFIFGSEERKQYTLDLYNSLNNREYTNIEDLEFTTIDDVIYMGMKNDTSFIIHAQKMLELYEQQSTFNPNMPLRGMMYYGKLYDAYLTKHELNRYGTRLIKIPTPQYIVFYNGSVDRPDKEILKLSDAFISPIDNKEECYEWTAKMLNINKGKNVELLKKCKPLADYSEVIYIIRENIKLYGKEMGIDTGIKDCIEKNLFSDIFIKNRAEVKGMFLTEYDEIEQIKIERAEAEEMGRQEGRMEEVFDSVLSEDYSHERGAQKLKMSLEDFEKKFEEWSSKNKKRNN